MAISTLDGLATPQANGRRDTAVTAGAGANRGATDAAPTASTAQAFARKIQNARSRQTPLTASADATPDRVLTRPVGDARQAGPLATTQSALQQLSTPPDALRADPAKVLSGLPAHTRRAQRSDEQIARQQQLLQFAKRLAGNLPAQSGAAAALLVIKVAGANCSVMLTRISATRWALAPAVCNTEQHAQLLQDEVALCQRFTAAGLGEISITGAR